MNRPILCHLGLHRWRRRTLPLSPWQEDMLSDGWPVRSEWERFCARGCTR